jgi:lipopolysaccharide export system protein LptA
MTRGRKANGIGRQALALAALLTLASLFFDTAQAQSQIGGFSGLSGANSKKPIDIESDRLEVDDKSHIAIFIGNVSATQGENNLKAPRLEVFYENASQQPAAGKGAQPAKTAKPAPAANAGASSDPLTSGQIKRIHALGGKVVVTSTKDNQEATGDDAIYDVKAQLITMTGKEVVLTQNKNKVKGTKLVIDLSTGKATVVNEAAGTASSGRIRAVFQQETGAAGKPINPLANTKQKGAPDPQQAAPAQNAAPPHQTAPSPWQPQSR